LSFYSLPYQPDTASKILDIYKRQIAEFSRSNNVDFSTIYIGGGTPSILGVDVLKGFLHYFNSLNNIEFSFEANPESLTEEKLHILKQYGINRISLGVQSFQDRFLKVLGSLHNAQQAKAALEMIFNAGFVNVSIDLMYALPGQRQNDLIQDLHIATSYPLKHISLYSLIYEEGTPLYRQKKEGLLLPVSEEQEAAMYDAALEFLHNKKFFRYEVSNFAKKQYQCRHNINYWKDRDFFAVGPSSSFFYKKKRKKYIADVSLYIENFQAGKSLILEEELIEGRKYAREKAALTCG